MKINLSEIVTMLEVLVISTKNRGYSDIELKEDWYLHVMSYDRECFETMQPKLGIGSLADDIEGLREMVRDEIASSLDFERLASVLISIARTMNE